MPIAQPRKRPSLIRFLERLPSSEFLVDPLRVSRKGDVAAKKNEQLQPPNAVQKIKKRVSFHNAVEVQPCLHADNYSDDEVANTWYSPEELLGMKRERKMTLRMVNKFSAVPSNSLTFRGLEARTKLGHLEKSANMLSGLMAIINEQARQKHTGKNDEEKLRQVYLSVTQHCQKQATEMGRRDEKDC